MEDREFSYDPELIEMVASAINHEKLEEKIKPQIELWVRERFDFLLERYFVKAEKWLAQAVQRQSEDDPINEGDRMAIWVIAKFLATSVTLPATEDDRIGYVRAVMALGYVLAKEGLDGKSVRNQDPGNVGSGEAPGA